MMSIDDRYPAVCTKEAFDHHQVVDAVGVEVLEELWPNVQVLFFVFIRYYANFPTRTNWLWCGC